MVLFGLILAEFPGKTFPYCHLLLRAFSLTLLSYQYCLETCASQCFHHSQHDLLYLVIDVIALNMTRVSCYFPCLWLLFTHVKIKGQIICWLGFGRVSLTAAELLQFAGCRGAGDGREQTPSRHPRISALQPASAPRPHSVAWFGYKIPQFSRAYYIHFHHNSLQITAATSLSSTKYKPNVLNSYFTVSQGSRTKETTKLSHLTSCITLKEQKIQPEILTLAGN